MIYLLDTNACIHHSDRGALIGPYDLQIAAIALVHDLTLITHNIGEFSRVQDLKIEDWQAD